MTTPNVAVRITGQDEGVSTLLRTLSRQLRDLESLNGRAGRATESFGRSAKDSASSLSRLNLAQASGVATVRNLARQLGVLAAAYLAVRGALAATAQGLNVNAELEQSALGIASIITAQGQLRDGTGKLLTGTQALNAAQAISAQQLQQLRVAGLQTNASFQQLSEAFQGAIGPGLTANLTLEQIRTTAIGVTQAASALGVPMNQLNQELRSILDGTIDVNSRVAKTLGITNEQVKLERERGTLYQFLSARLAAFNVAGEKSAATFEGIRSNIKEALDTFAATATQPLFDRMKVAGQAALSGIFDLNTAQIAPAFAGIAATARQAFAGLGDLLASALTGAVNGAKALSAFLDRNRTAIAEFARLTGDAVTQLVRVVVEAGRIVASIVSASVQAGVLSGALKTVADVARLVADVLQGIADSKVAIGVTAITIAVVALSRAIGGLSALPTALGLAGLSIAANPFTAAAVALVGLVVVLNSVEAAARRVRIEQSQLREQQAKMGDQANTLAREYAAQARELATGKLKGDAARAAIEQLRQKQAQLVQLAPQYRQAIQGATGDYAKQAEAVDGVLAATLRLQAVEATRQAAVVSQLRGQLALLKAQAAEVDNGVAGGNPFGSAAGTAVRRRGAANAIVGVQAELAAAEAALKAQTDALTAAGNAYAEAQAQLTTPPKVTPTTTGGLKAAADARLEAVRAEIARARALAEAALQDRAQQNEIANRAGLVSLAAYFDERAAIIRAGTAAEVRELEQQRAALAASPILTDPTDAAKTTAERVKRTRELADLEQRIALAQQTGARELAGLQADRIAAEKELTANILEAEAKVRAARGETLADTLRGIQQEGAAYDALLQRQGVNAGDRQVRVRLFLDTLTAQAQFQDFQRQGQQALDALARERQRITNLADTGVISQREAQRQILVLEQQRAPVVRSIADDLTAAAAALGPDAQGEAQRFGAEVSRIGVAVSRADLLFKNFAQNVTDAAEGDLANVLSQLGREITTFGDAFRALASSVVQSIQRIAAELVAAKIVRGIGGLFAGGTSNPFDLTGFASGGYVSGPGTATSDSIPARLSAGEYVLRAAAVQKIGVPTLDAMNALRTPVRRAAPSGVQRFAEGGLVTAGAGRGELAATIGLEDGLVIKGMTSRAGESAQLETIRRNARTIRAVLGV